MKLKSVNQLTVCKFSEIESGLQIKLFKKVSQNIALYKNIANNKIMDGSAGSSKEAPNNRERTPDLETLRGPNGTLNLSRVIEESTVFSANRRAFNMSPKPTIIQHAVGDLQAWARPVNLKVMKAASLDAPTSKPELDSMVAKLIAAGKIDPKLDFLGLFKFYDKKMLARQDQWEMMKALYGIDISVLSPGHFGGWSLQETASLEDVHDYMIQLMIRSVSNAGGKLEDITPQDQKGEQRIITAPTKINGVTGAVTMRNIGFRHAEGLPNITGVEFKLEPSFLASVRPLNADQYNKYWPEQKSYAGSEGNKTGSHENRQQTGSGPQNESSNQRQEHGRPRDRGDYDPKDPSGYYKTLGVNPDMDPEDLEEVLESAYRRLSRKYHPDTGGNKADHDKMKALNEAYQFLKKDSNRDRYGR